MAMVKRKPVFGRLRFFSSWSASYPTGCSC
jgi:hypothetical protein